MNISNIKLFFTKKRIIWISVILVIILGGWFFFGRKGVSSTIQTGVVKKQNIERTVLTTGQVMSETNLDLSFQSTGVVRAVNVKEGQTVYAGQTLAVLDQGIALANLQSAQASLAQAQANFKKVSAAATVQDVAVSQATVDVASTALANAKQNLLRQIATTYSDVSASVVLNTNPLFSNPQSQSPQFGLSGTVQNNSQLVTNVNGQRVVLNSTFDTWQTEVATLSDTNVDSITQSSIAHLTATVQYLENIITLLTSYTQVTSGGSQTTLATYQTSVTSARTTASTAITTLTTYSQAVRTAQANLDQAKASLALKQSPARPEDIAIAEAQVKSAESTVSNAEVNLGNTVIRAPISGTITQVDIKIGEQAQALKEVMKIQNVAQLHTEALVSEADIAYVEVGQSIDNTFDALGPDKHFTSAVLTVNPASTVISGVVNYKVTGSLENIPGVKPGMTANMVIRVAEKADALVIPSSAIVNKNNTKVVRVITDPKKKTYSEVTVTTGLEADGGLTEIVSGLTEGQEVVTYMK